MTRIYLIKESLLLKKPLRKINQLLKRFNRWPDKHHRALSQREMKIYLTRKLRQCQTYLNKEKRNKKMSRI